MSKTLVYPHTTSGFQRHAFTSIASCMQKKRLRIRTTKLCVLSCKSKDTIHGHLHFGLKKASRYVTHSRSFDEIGLSRPPLKDSEGSTSKIPQSSKGNRRTPSQEELLSLFRRIQASIAEGESSRAKKIKPKPKDEKPTAESILEILHNSQKQERDNNAVEGRNESKKTIGSLPKEKREVEDSSLPTSNFKLTRPPSNFIKRSAIPALSTPRGLDHLVNSAARIERNKEKTNSKSTSSTESLLGMKCSSCCQIHGEEIKQLPWNSLKLNLLAAFHIQRNFLMGLDLPNSSAQRYCDG